MSSSSESSCETQHKSSDSDDASSSSIASRASDESKQSFSPPTPPSKKQRLSKKKWKINDIDTDNSEEESSGLPGGSNEVAASEGSVEEEAGGEGAAGAILQQVISDDSSSIGSSLPVEDHGDNEESDSDTANLRRSPSSSEGLEEEINVVVEEQVNVVDDGSKPKYEGSTKTKDEVVLEVLDLYLTNKWTKKSLEGVLKCMASNFPENNRMPSTLYRLFQYLKAHAPHIEEIAHFYCASSLSEKESKSAVCLKCETLKSGVFFEIPLKDQIKFLFESYGLAEAIDSFPHTHEDSVLKDIQGRGEFLKVKSKCTGKYDITLLCNTDGVDLSKSSHVKLWPVQAVICEVPYHLRPRYTFVCNVWVEKCKPKMNVYLKPLVNSLRDLWENGVEWTHPITKENNVFKVVAPALCADAPATADVLSVQDVTAIFGCNLCEQEAAAVLAFIKGKMKTIRRFIYQKEPARLRTGERIKKHAKLAKIFKKPYKGVKGRSVVRKIPFFDSGSSVPIDYMHCALLGVVKRITDLWFFVKSNIYGKDWYIGDKLKKANKSISESVKVPDFVSRDIRGLDMLDEWKASELLTWLLYHSLPVLIFVEMPTRYVEHHMLLVKAIFLLLKDRVSEADLAEAEQLLNRYVAQMSSLYRNQDLVYNVHSLLHLPLCVRRLGPLFATSAFRFQDFNGTLAAMIHGTKHQAKELANKLRLARGISALKWKVEQTLSQAARDIVLLVKERAASQDEIILLQAKKIRNVTEVYDRCENHGKTFTSRTHDETVVRSNSFVLVRRSPTSHVLGQILYFSRSEEGVFCTVETFETNHVDVLANISPPYPLCKIDHLIPISNRKKEKIVCNLSDIEDKLVKAGNFLCRRPNKCEKKL